MADVPAIMRPTQAQITIPHPKCLDFIPFPALRNYLCFNQHKDARHSVDLYLRSMRLVLPPGKTLMIKTERGDVELNPSLRFSRRICVTGAWTRRGGRTFLTCGSFYVRHSEAGVDDLMGCFG
ncbi:hypothetical protein BM221_010865 [Beauveria bassiana]|uniref:Uncharacterized protein n=1 Tax=Beauveria bassiana TaxID=176275 RepID=A0A2N6N7S2_BEABA|nr:hypothetical protein BM221_010865 [Beauveria bassiana]